MRLWLVPAIGLALVLFQNCGPAFSPKSVDGSADAASNGDVNSPAPSPIPTPAPAPVPAPVALPQNKWQAMTASGAPYESRGSVVWTGQLFYVFGTPTATARTNVLAAYNPATNTWTNITAANQPSYRLGAKLFWTGNRLVVVGGSYLEAGTALLRYNVDGAVYDPAANTWTRISGTNAHPTFVEAFVASTGTRLLFFGGGYNLNTINAQTYNNVVSSYDPVTNTWTRMAAAAGVPSPRSVGFAGNAYWTGSKLLVYRGQMWVNANNNTSYPTDLYAYDPALNSWQKLSSVGASTASQEFSSFWNGTKLIIWGGAEGAAQTYIRTNKGWIFDLATNTWSTMSTVNAPTRRTTTAAAMIGSSKMVVFGGYAVPDPNGVIADATDTGGIYDFVTNTWAPTSLTLAPGARYQHSGTSIGDKVIFFGGATNIPSAQNLLTAGGIFY